jgi:hypothetical protein
MCVCVCLENAIHGINTICLIVIKHKCAMYFTLYDKKIKNYFESFYRHTFLLRGALPTKYIIYGFGIPETHLCTLPTEGKTVIKDRTPCVQKPRRDMQVNSWRVPSVWLVQKVEFHEREPIRKMNGRGSRWVAFRNLSCQ